MCRWFVYCSGEEDCLLEDVLVLPQHSLSKMVNDHYLPGLIDTDPNSKKQSDEDKRSLASNVVLNIDGLGLAWYSWAKASYIKGCEGPRPSLYKSVSPPLNDFNYRSLCANTETKMLFAHVRASSGSAVIQPNCHPFVFGRHSFMHNGTINKFIDIRRPLCALLDQDAFANVGGSTDTEHLAALFMSILSKRRGASAWEEEYSCKEMAAALREAVGTVIRLQIEAHGKDARPNSLNLAVTDGFRLVTFRFRNHKTQAPPSLYWSTTAGVTLNRKYPGHPDGKDYTAASKKAKDHGKHLIVASEPTTMQEKEWKLIPRNHCVMMEKNGSVKMEKIVYDDSWNVTDASPDDSSDAQDDSVDDSWVIEDALLNSQAAPSRCVVS